jgi:endo-1,4-beta-xylanase
VLEQRARRYGELMRLCVQHRGTITRVTLWGPHDGRSWLNHYPVRARTNHPLLFDRRLQPKPAFDAVLKALAGGQ